MKENTMRKLSLILFLSLFTVACGHSQQQIPSSTSATVSSVSEASNGKKIAERKGIFARLLASKSKTGLAQRQALIHKNQVKKLEESGVVKPYGETFPVAELGSCGDLKPWESEPTIGRKVVKAVKRILKNKTDTCAWSQKFLECRGVLLVLENLKSGFEPQTEEALQLYQSCQE
jgi:hypothetical protein